MNTIFQTSNRGGGSRARRPIVLVLVLVAWMALAGGTASSAEPQTYTASISFESTTPPRVDQVPAGAVGTFYVTLVNTSSQQYLGSANIYAPTGFTVTGGSSPGANVTVRDNIVQVRDLSLAPSQSRVVAVQASAPCTPGTVAWRIEAKQANNFNGPPGNVFTLDTASSYLDVTVVGGCGVKLQFLRQPADAEVDTAITSERVNPDGDEVQIEVVDADGNRAIASTAEITIRLYSVPAGALDHILTPVKAAAEEGVATFTGLSANLHGSDYRLHATSDGLTAATSGTFTIWDQVVRCDSDESCSTTIQDRGSMQATVDMAATVGPVTSGALLVSLGADTVDCKDPFNHAPSAVTVDSVGLDGAKTVTLRVDKAVDQQQSNNGVSFYEVCFKRPGEPEFLLPACGAADPPCIAAKTKTKAGDVIVTVNLPAGDPIMR